MALLLGGTVILIVGIIDDVYQQTGAFDIPGYLKFGRNRTR